MCRPDRTIAEKRKRARKRIRALLAYRRMAIKRDICKIPPFVHVLTERRHAPCAWRWCVCKRSHFETAIKWSLKFICEINKSRAVACEATLLVADIAILVEGLWLARFVHPCRHNGRIERHDCPGIGSDRCARICFFGPLCKFNWSGSLGAGRQVFPPRWF